MCPCPEQDISFESKNNWFCPFTRNRNYLRMHPLLWQPREDLLLYLPVDLSCSSFCCLLHFHTPNFSSLLPCPSDFPITPLSFSFFFPTSFPNSSHMFFTEFTRLHGPHTTMSSLVFSDRDFLHVSMKTIRRWQPPYGCKQECFLGKCNSDPNCQHSNKIISNPNWIISHPHGTMCL